jgi:hypothetical protein
MSDPTTTHPYEAHLQELPANPPPHAYGSGFDMRALPVPSGNLNAPATTPAATPTAPSATFSAQVTPTALPSKEEQLASILNQLTTSRGADISDVTPPGVRMADMSFNSHTGAVEVTRAGKITPFADADLGDSNLNIDATAAQINAGVAAIEAKLAATTFDKAGKATPVLQGRDREVAERQLTSARESAAYQLARLQAQQVQRDSRTQRSTQAQGEDVARAAFSGGDPARAKALEEAELRVEAEAFARSLRKARGAQ